jgi:hypothetical protein
MAGTEMAAALRQAQDDAPIPMMRMCHPEGAGCSFAGRRYKADAGGAVLVPVEAVLPLLAHGFVPVEDE